MTGNGMTYLEVEGVDEEELGHVGRRLGHADQALQRQKRRLSVSARERVRTENEDK